MDVTGPTNPPRDVELSVRSRLPPMVARPLLRSRPARRLHSAARKRPHAGRETPAGTNTGSVVFGAGLLHPRKVAEVSRGDERDSVATGDRGWRSRETNRVMRVPFTALAAPENRIMLSTNWLARPGVCCRTRGRVGYTGEILPALLG